LGTDRNGGTVMQFHEATALYNNQVAQHLAGEGAANVLRDLERLEAYFGKTRLLTEISNGDIAKLVAWRRGQQVARFKKIKGKLVQNPKAPLVSNATVNRSTTEVLKKIFIRARDTWGVKFEAWPKWNDHVLKEAAERVRELHDGEGEAIMDQVRGDYAPLIEFSHATGVRQKEAWSLEWTQVNWGTKTITMIGKGGKLVTKTIDPEVHAILWPLVATIRSGCSPTSPPRPAMAGLLASATRLPNLGSKPHGAGRGPRLASIRRSCRCVSMICAMTSRPSCCARPGISGWCRRR
jgi:integrase